jgi:hypothetical protein
VSASSSATTSSIGKQWKRSWARKVAWPWRKREIEIVSKVTGVLVVSLWLKRLVEQFLGRKVLNEPVLRGEVNDIVRGIENDVEEGAQTMLGRANEIVITVDPVREEAKGRPVDGLTVTYVSDRSARRK